MGILTRILAEKAQEITALKREKFVVEPRSRSAASWVESLRRPASHPLHLLAEIKQKSPSAGMLSSALTKVQRGLVYAECGASMVSVLCDGPFFGGSYGDLRDVRNALRLAGRETPVLAKEFVLHTVQIDAAAAHGADAVLLIVRILAEGALWELLEHARSRGIEPLVEVATEPELETALRAGARVIGVNARDLDTLAMDPERAARVLAAIPRDILAIHLSGIKTPNDVLAVAQGRADAALIGEALMREDDPRAMLHAFVRAASAPRPTVPYSP